MSFHEIRFPETISRGARGGPERRTQIVTLASGDEERNASWANSRRRYDVSYGVRKMDDIALIVAFFEARNGRLFGFRFKDWSDYKSCVPSAAPAATDQLIGTGNGSQTAFQLRKAYASGAQTWQRQIIKPVAGTVLVALNGVAQGAGWMVDLATGIVTFAVAPGAGVSVRAGFEFDVPVRFDSDELAVTLALERSGDIPSIPLVEVRNAVSASAEPGPAVVQPAPTVISAPSISGTAQVGQTLSAAAGTYTGSPTITRAWLRNGVVISGATGATYVLGTADDGATISLRETATNSGGSIQATSNGLGPVLPAPWSITPGDAGAVITSAPAVPAIPTVPAWAITPGDAAALITSYPGMP